ncbi:1-deoxy-D-xylulose-5-phosphate synthase [Puniceicoccus vermicola]|uniref:1-deoxy-D-xylulose-5-phosphate synthase n=1 Tax=Puniceicoccus vermicola TaxID=388746 RepID=A0A7X1E685_9BACT|nr:1-deoxy-D-xylulose-5-phosphate synthase [Puniceicoccus vermicola]
MNPESILSKIRNPGDVKALDKSQLEPLATEIRKRIIEVTAANGGHVGPNLGVVELTIALHRIFDTPKDRFVFDVSHQGYVHKLLTGRNDEKFNLIRQKDGYSGFLNREESEHDCYGAGHAGTALSAALGMAAARDQRGTDENVVAVCGDAAFTCGITLEALNNITDSTKRLVVILNDNEWSIDKNVGALSRYFNELITTPIYNRMNEDFEAFLKRVPGGESLIRLGSKWKRETKDFFASSSIFENFGLRYIGPIDGHNIGELEQYLKFARNAPEPLVLHVITKKGKGSDVAIAQPERFHGTSPFDPETGSSKPGAPGSPPKYQDVVGEAVVAHCKKDKTIVGITAAMPSGTGFDKLRDSLPQQYYDVGIAEEHAVLFAAGMATNGLHPVCAIYSTFLQRGIDPIIHDICLQNLPVLFCMDRAGLSPNDGATHHGLFDIAYLRGVPRTVIMQPQNEDELTDMVATGLQHQGPAFIRYPRGSGTGVPIKKEPKILEIGKAEVIRQGQDVQIWALGTMISEAETIASRIAEISDLSVGVVNARFAKPIDSALLQEQAKSAKLIVTLEDHVRTGGFGTAVLEDLSDAGIPTPVERIGWPDQFIEHGNSNKDLRQAFGLDPQSIFDRVNQRLEAIGATQNLPTSS